VQVRNCFLFLAMPIRVVSGKSKPIRVRFHIGILRLRALMDDILFLGKGNVLNLREIISANSKISFEAYFGFQPFVKLKT
jgi:hypothetical protein